MASCGLQMWWLGALRLGVDFDESIFGAQLTHAQDTITKPPKAKPPTPCFSKPSPENRASPTLSRPRRRKTRKTPCPACSGSAAFAPTCAAPRRRFIDASRRPGPRLPAVRLFRPWRIGRRFRARRDRHLGGGSFGGFSRAHPRPANRDRLLHGRLGGPAARPRAGEGGRKPSPRRHGADRPGGRFHRGPDVAATAGRRAPGDREQGSWIRPADILWRGLSADPPACSRMVARKNCSEGKSAPFARSRSCKAWRTPMCPGVIR